jgi:hypothetical protein
MSRSFRRNTRKIVLRWCAIIGAIVLSPFVAVFTVARHEAVQRNVGGVSPEILYCSSVDFSVATCARHRCGCANCLGARRATATA